MIPSRKEEMSDRLLAVASLIPKSDLVVDVGSDHGKMGAWCIQNGICESLIATDIHEAPCKRTESFLRAMGLAAKSQVKMTDGLCGVTLKENTSVVIAGMGGLEIRKILTSALQSSGIPKGTCFVLQPQRSYYELRSFLSSEGFTIREEKIEIERGHFYVVIQCFFEGTPYSLSDAQLFFGPFILKEKPEHYEEYMTHQKAVMQKQALGNPMCVEILKNWEEWT
ncbi:MAG: SAM-dependent methyltransferase [Clostridiales bacterium]|nr:SAM-dependent methyltransferase [Clostridiales bacterium]